MPWVNATGLRRPRTALEHVTRTTKFHADGTSSVRDSTSTAAEVAAVHAEAAKDSEDVPTLQQLWCRSGCGLAPLAVTLGQLGAPRQLAAGPKKGPPRTSTLHLARVTPAAPLPVAFLGPFGTLYVRSIHPS